MSARADVYVVRVDGSVRVWAFDVPLADAKEMLWIAVRENTVEADRQKMQASTRVEVRVH